jgi:two-component system KDP operon response regulator KdpE
MSQTILLIDDDTSLLNLLGKYLEKAGYGVLRASSGLAGIQTLFEGRPDLVALDLMMPGMDGWETCRFAELTARIGAVLARVTRTEVAPREVLEIRGVTLNRRTRQVTRDGDPLQLSPTEFRLLAHLMDHAGEPLSPATLVTEVWGPAYADDKGYIKRYIWYLRQKVELDPADPQYILTERGFGYRFVA